MPTPASQPLTSFPKPSRRAMPEIIENQEFTLFWDRDRQKLRTLSYEGCVEWLRRRINAILLKPLQVLKDRERDAFVWLAATELVCAGIEALSGFYGNGRHGTAKSSFCRFVHAFMHSDFSLKTKNIDGDNWTYCEHLRAYFRSGLDHGFSIEWGGLWHDGEDGTHGYLRPAGDGEGIAICPRQLLADFSIATDRYFERLLQDGKNSVIGQNFQSRFRAILGQRSRRH
jgi:hypothetical protein